MRISLSAIVLLALVACGGKGDSASDTTARPDTSALHSAGSAPHPAPAAVDTASDTTKARPQRR